MISLITIDQAVTRVHGARVARLTPDQQAGSSNLSGLIVVLQNLFPVPVNKVFKLNKKHHIPGCEFSRTKISFI